MNEDSLQVLKSNTENIMDILKIVIWPAVAIIIVLLLKKSITDLLSRVTKIGYGKLGAETAHPKQDTKDKSPFVNETVQKALGIYSQETIDRAIHIVNTESKVEEINSDGDKVQALHKYAQALYLILSFERIYTQIFGSQLLILDSINTNDSETKATLKRFYDTASQYFAEFYATYPYDEYFQFLVVFELIVPGENGTWQITWLGRDFLKYLVETGKPLLKKF